jgi:hypothetical protein
MIKRTLAYLALPLLIAANWLVFKYLLDLDYLRWFLDNGSTISLASGFVALIWGQLQIREDLVALHPVKYFAACLQLAGVTTFSLGTHLRGRAYGAGAVWDVLIFAILSFLILVVVVAWVLVISPVNYLLTIVAGAPARVHLRGKNFRTVVTESDNKIEIREERREGEIPPGDVDVSFAKNPFAVTQAMNALFLWLIKALL